MEGVGHISRGLLCTKYGFCRDSEPVTEPEPPEPQQPTAEPASESPLWATERGRGEAESCGRALGLRFSSCFVFPAFLSMCGCMVVECGVVGADIVALSC